MILLPFGPGTPSYISWRLDIRWIYIILFSFSITTLITPLIIKLGYRFKILDYPDERKLHKDPVPRIGGLAVILGFFISILRHSEPFTYRISYLPVFVASGFFIIHFLDDAGLKLSSALRFLLQVVISLIAAVMGLKITLIPHMPFENLIEVLITVIWITGITNAFNFLDGIDGLASGLSGIITFSMVFLAWKAYDVDASVILSALCGASIGFLVFNLTPARAFLGDSGSTFMGSLIASTAVLQSWAKEEEPLMAATLPVTLISIPIFDMTLTTLFRVIKGKVKSVNEWLAFTGKDHIHHRIINLGFSPAATLSIILCIQFIVCINGIILKMSESNFIAVLLFFQSLFIYIVAGAILWKR